MDFENHVYSNKFCYILVNSASDILLTTLGYDIANIPTDLNLEDHSIYYILEV